MIAGASYTLERTTDLGYGARQFAHCGPPKNIEIMRTKTATPGTPDAEFWDPRRSL